MLDLLLTGTIALAIALILLWGVSILTNRVSFIDSFWGASFVLIAAVTASTLNTLGEMQFVTLILVTLWGTRLGIHLLRRFLDEGEDKRYVRLTKDKEGISRHTFTLWFVFGLQGILILVISAPIFSAFAHPPANLDSLSYIGIALWGLGAFFEWVGDWQLKRFKSNPDNEGKVLDTGLWAWTRHPNYFGDTCIWWGIWLVGHDITVIFAPAAMTFLLIKWSGVPLLEAGMKKRRPDYQAYIERTSSFFPRPPRSN
jgi:steroid 5-alpha reductase family enzyme